MKTAIVRPTKLRGILRLEGKRVSRAFILAFDAAVVAAARSYCRIHDGTRKTLMADLLEVFPLRRGFVMPEPKRRTRRRP